MTIFARIDHSAGAAKVGMKLRSTELLIFGNPQGGTSHRRASEDVSRGFNLTHYGSEIRRRLRL